MSFSPKNSTDMGVGQRLVAMENEVKFKVIVAIDFGTHGTGLGYAPINDNEEKEQIYVDQDWCSNTDTKNKTDILLTHDGIFITFGDDALKKYQNKGDEDYLPSDSDASEDEDEDDEDDEKEKAANLARKRPMLFESFKMALYVKKEDGSDGDIRDKLKSQNGREWQTSKIFIEALKYMKETIFKTFAKNGISKTLDKDNPIKDIQWILTVPAIWSERAKHKMERWAQQAGLIDRNIFKHLRIVYEPDCASISCQYEAADEDEKSFQPGERYILIDAGGGTVDIACHQVKAPFEMEEIYHPTGGPWGSDYIDDEFDKLLDEVFGQGAVDTFRSTYPANYTTIRDNFRKQKMNFYNKPDAEFLKVELTMDFKTEIAAYSPEKFHVVASKDDDFESIVSNSRPYGLEAGKHLQCKDDALLISKTIWRKHLFDKVIDPMIDHVKSLIKKVDMIKAKGDDDVPKKLTYLCIAGGLASSRYFQHRVHEAFGKGSEYNLSIRVPRRPILSVIDGALRLGLRPNYIKTRRVKYTYGIAVDRSEKNVEKIKDKLPANYIEENSYTHPNTHKRTVRNLFSAFIKKNDAVDLDEAIEKKYRRFHKNEKTSKISIYYSPKEEPYYIEKNQQPLASVTITFPDEYQGLPFIVQFFFGETQIRAKVLYEDKSNNKDNKQPKLMRDLELEFHDLFTKE